MGCNRRYGTRLDCPECDFEPFVAQPLLHRQADGRGASSPPRRLPRRQDAPPQRAPARLGRGVRPQGRASTPTPDCRGATSCVEPGSALDCCGHEILVPEEEIVDVASHPGGARAPDAGGRRGCTRCSSASLPRMPDRGGAGALRRVRLRRHPVRAEPHPRVVRLRRAGRSAARHGLGVWTRRPCSASSRPDRAPRSPPSSRSRRAATPTTWTPRIPIGSSSSTSRRADEPRSPPRVPSRRWPSIRAASTCSPSSGKPRSCARASSRCRIARPSMRRTTASCPAASPPARRSPPALRRPAARSCPGRASPGTCGRGRRTRRLPRTCSRPLPAPRSAHWRTWRRCPFARTALAASRSRALRAP